MRKVVVLLLNIISIVICILTLCFVRIQYPNNDIFQTISEPNFFNSNSFSTIVNQKLDIFFNYIILKQAFETYGEFDPNRIIAKVDEDNFKKDVTINDILNLAKEYNISITNDYKIVFDVASEIHDTGILNFTNYYGKNIHTPNDNIRISRREFVITFMEDLANYRKAINKDFAAVSNFKYLLMYDYANLRNIIYTNSSFETNEEIYDNSFIYVNSSNRLNTTNIKDIKYNVASRIQNINPLKLSANDFKYTFSLVIDNNLIHNDDFKEALKDYDNERNFGISYVILLTVSFLIFILTFFILIIKIFKTNYSPNYQDNILTAISTEIYIFSYIVLCIVVYAVIGVLKNYSDFIYNRQNRFYLYILCFYVLTIVFFFILSIKFESNTLYSEFFRNIKEDLDNQLKLFNKKNLFWFALFPIFVTFTSGLYTFYISIKTDLMRFVIIGLVLIATSVILSFYLLMLFRSFTDTINEKNKSNEMKSVLISNISHDIKTPLTSIINYSEIIHETVRNKKTLNKTETSDIIDYSSIIKDKSVRLNQLLNDIIFDAKATSGNLTYDIIKMNINEFVEQMILEFSPDLIEKNLKISYNHPDEKLYINADSDKLYRVFQNLFNNINKYSLPNSIVFVDITKDKNKININMRNIQKDPIDADDTTLKERFWQGNDSRSETGFGLGLSITSNLIKAMGGKFTAIASRDIFTTIISFSSK